MSSILKGLVDEDTGMDWEEKLMDVWAPFAAKHMAKVVKQAFNSLYPDVKLKVWAEAEGVSATTDLTSDDVKADVFGQYGKKDWECNFFCGPLYNVEDDRKYLELMVDDASSGNYPGVWKIIVSEWKSWATSQLKKTGADDVCFSVNEDMSGGAWGKIAKAVGIKFIAHDLDEGMAESNRLYKYHQKLRKQAGLPDPQEYLRMQKQKLIELILLNDPSQELNVLELATIPELEEIYQMVQKVDEDNTYQFAAEKTPPVSPYAGIKDNQFRGAIGENYLINEFWWPWKKKKQPDPYTWQTGCTTNCRWHEWDGVSGKMTNDEKEFLEFKKKNKLNGISYNNPLYKTYSELKNNFIRNYLQRANNWAKANNYGSVPQFSHNTPADKPNSSNTQNNTGWMAPHGDSENEYKLFLNGSKPAAIAYINEPWWNKLIQSKKYPILPLKRQGKNDRIVIVQPGDEARAKKIQMLVQTATDRAEAGDFSAYQNSNYHRTLGRLLGYPEKDIEQFIQHYFRDKEDLAQTQYKEGKQMKSSILEGIKQLVEDPNYSPTDAGYQERGWRVMSEDEMNEDLRKWFKEKWVRFGPDGKIRGACARGSESEGKPKCLPQSKAHSLGKKGRASAAARKRREDPDANRSGAAKNVATKKKTNEEQLDELKCWPGYTRVKGVPAGAPGSCKKKTKEAANPAQQAAIAISMKKAGKKPKTNEEKRIPRKPSQPANSKKHSDLYTDENPKGTIHGLKFATVEDAKASVNKIKNSGKTHAHKIQAAIAMEQRAKAAGKASAAQVFRTYINSIKKSNEANNMNEASDISGLLAASHLNKSFIITAETAEGQKKKFRVKAQNERIAKEKFLKHHTMAKIISVKEEGISEEKCPHCSGPMFEVSLMNEKKDACYYKVKSRYKVWPSAYASGALVKCRKKGAKNWGNKPKSNEGQIYSTGGGAGQSYRYYTPKDNLGESSSILNGIKKATMRLHEFRVKPVDSIYKTPQDKPRQPQIHLRQTKKQDSSQPAAKINFAHELEKYKRLGEDSDKCPPATQDIKLNLKNRQKAIDEYGYGPLNPAMPNRKFWLKKVEEWNLDSVDEAKSSLCGNCAAFDIKSKTLDCIATGIGGDTETAEEVIDVGELGYCRFLKFKCASKRTCDAWVTGGPLTDEKISEGNDQEFYTGGGKGMPFPTTYEQEYKPFERHGQRRITAMTNEDMKDLGSVIINFYKNIPSFKKKPVQNYEEISQEYLNKIDSRFKNKLNEIIEVGKKNPYLQGGIITTIGALLAGGILSMGSKYGLTPTQTNIMLQGILNTVIPTLVCRINGRDWKDTIKYTLASAGTGVGIASLTEKWSEKYKRSINCNNPKGFSQRAHCQGRKKK